MATNNPIGSQAPDDFKFNVANIDRAMNSDAATFTSRAASDQPAREQFTWSEIQRRAVVEISAAEQAKIDAQAARDDAQAIAETLAAVKIYRTHALAVAGLPNLQDGDNVEINQDETTDGLRTRYVVVSGALSDKTILSTVVNATTTPIVDTAAWEDVPVLESTPATIAAALNTVAQKLAKRTKWLYDAVASFDISVLVQKTSSTGVAILPEGGDAGRPTTIPTDGGLIRANNAAGDYFLEFRNRVANAWESLATRVWVIAKINELISNAVGFTIIYPNGGTEAYPANVTANSRYVLPNPFLGYHVFVEAELLINDKWTPIKTMQGQLAINFTPTAYGTIASEYDGGIVVQTGLNGITSNSNITGIPNNTVTVSVTTAPCRVKVWKAKGVI